MSNSPEQFPRLKSSQDWHNLANTAIGKKLTLKDLANARAICYKEIEQLRGRPLIVYFSKFIVPKGVTPSISMEDIEGFTDLVNSVNNSESVDVLIHSPGGSADVTERIVNILQTKFKEVHFLIPHSAYSAATMLALSGDSITIHPSATLGPIDPQIDGIPARSIKRGFENAKSKIKDEGPQVLPAYIPLIQKYTLHLLEICEDAEKLSKELVHDWLKAKMLKGKDKTEIEKVVDYFSAYDVHLTHSRPLLFDKLKGFGLPIAIPEKKLQDLLWEIYLHVSGFLNSTPWYKLYENTHGISWGKQIVAPSNTPPDQVPNQLIGIDN